MRVIRGGEMRVMSRETRTKKQLPSLLYYMLHENVYYVAVFN